MHMAENGFCEHGEQEAMLARGDTEIGASCPLIPMVVVSLMVSLLAHRV